MTEISIDNSKLPGVKEVCRDFAVLEDHSLAHTLQEQEIEHHLSTNIQRNRLVKHDLKVAKQLQEEEDLRAQVKIKNRHTELELLDCEIAQEIQDKLVIEAELRRRQEEKDEDIARVLQEREEKRRKKYSSSRSPEDPYYLDHEGHRRDRHKEQMSENDRHRRHERPARNRKERGVPKSEHSSHYDDRKRGRSAEPRSVSRDDNSDFHRDENPIARTSTKRDKPQRPPPPRTSRHEGLGKQNTNGEHSSENLPRGRRSQSHDLGSKNSGIPDNQDSSNSRANKRGARVEYEDERRRRRSPSPQDERLYRDPGHRSKGPKEASQTKLTAGARTREKYDAEIARRLQEKELRVSSVDIRAAQMAQDEEIARWLMEREEKSHKKSKGRDKMSDSRRTEELEVNTHEHVRPRSRDDQHRTRSDKPYRPLPPPPDEDLDDDDYVNDYTNRISHNSPRSSSKPQSSHKGSYYRQ
ncbi:coiled-coil domain-containing protein 50 isoform X1 [Mixophyes fleayi]|uniref:coiled-coil domain-containing protein 50 isoform X1 n=1 Tax=Mixophyes fleayi TaxID=3061075 RepID=UPI003F4D887B